MRADHAAIKRLLETFGLPTTGMRRAVITATTNEATVADLTFTVCNADEVTFETRTFQVTEVPPRDPVRDSLRWALAECWSGADYSDADAVLDKLDDAGLKVVRK